MRWFGATPIRVADQIASGMSNLALPLLAAHYASPSQFGTLSAGLTTLVACLSVTRASLGNLIALASSSGGHAIRAASAYATGFLVFCAPAVTMMVAIPPLVAGGGQSLPTISVLAFSAPIVLIQDLLRFEASALASPGIAFAADCIWLGIVGFFALAWGASNAVIGLAAISLIWSLGALASMLMLGARLKSLPRFTGMSNWMRQQGPYLLSTIGSTAVVALTNVARVGMIGGVLGPAAVGALAAGQLIMTPLNLLVALIPFAATPVIAHGRHSVSPSLAYALLAGASICASTIWWLLCLGSPGGLGLWILGNQWFAANALLAPMALLSIGVLVTACGTSLLLLLGRHRSFSAVALGVSTSSILGTVWCLGAAGGVQQLAWTQTAVVLLGSALAWYLARAPISASEDGSVFHSQSKGLSDGAP